MTMKTARAGPRARAYGLREARREIRRRRHGQRLDRPAPALKTLVAVKFLAGHMAQDPAAGGALSARAMAAARIKVPHVVQIFDHGVSPDFGPYIVMERLEGETLSSFVLATDAYAGVRREDHAQLCRALGKAHGQGSCIATIKPDNVFLSRSGARRVRQGARLRIAKNLATS